MRRTLCAISVLALLLAAGCEEPLKADRDARVADLDLRVEGIGLQPEGGVPAEVRVSVRNRSQALVAFTVPRPLPGEETEGSDELPLPCLLLHLEDAEGHDEMPTYTDPRATRRTKPRRIVLGLGQEWSATYAIDDFYFWGPCGPDTGGSFAKYFWRGEREVTLAAVIMFDKASVLRSKPIRLQCTVEDWLFRKKHQMNSP